MDEIKRDILNLYESDFAKIDATGRLAMLFDAIPAELNKNAARYQVNSVLGGEKIEKVLELIAELKDSKTVLVSYNVNDQMPECRILRTYPDLNCFCVIPDYL